MRARYGSPIMFTMAVGRKKNKIIFLAAKLSSFLIRACVCLPACRLIVWQIPTSQTLVQLIEEITFVEHTPGAIKSSFDKKQPKLVHFEHFPLNSLFPHQKSPHRLSGVVGSAVRFKKTIKTHKLPFEPIKQVCKTLNSSLNYMRVHSRLF